MVQLLRTRTETLLIYTCVLALLVFATVKPKRCLTAYNIFFQHERQRLLERLPGRVRAQSKKKGHGKIGFAELGRTISRNWKAVSADQKPYYYELAKLDKKRYVREMEEWRALLAAHCSADPTTVEVRRGNRSSDRIATPSSTNDGSSLVEENPISDIVVSTVAPTPSVEDEMHSMPTEDLVEIAVADNDVTTTFVFDAMVTGSAPVPVDEEDPEENHLNTPTGRAEAADLAQTLDADCQDFLLSAFSA